MIAGAIVFGEANDHALFGVVLVRSYNVILSAIELFYSNEIGNTPEMIALFQERMRQMPSYRESARRELLESLGDTAFSWKHALWNDGCHVEDFSSEEEARDYLVSSVLPVIDRPTTSGHKT